MSIAQGLEATIRLLRVRLEAVDKLKEQNTALEGRLHRSLTELETFNKQNTVQSEALDKMYDSNDKLQDTITSLEEQTRLLRSKMKHCALLLGYES